MISHWFPSDSLLTPHWLYVDSHWFFIDSYWFWVDLNENVGKIKYLLCYTTIIAWSRFVKWALGLIVNHIYSLAKGFCAKMQFLKDFADFVTIECASRVAQNASALLKIGRLPSRPSVAQPLLLKNSEKIIEFSN